jgi:glutamate/tyrosine decarboxylase-like PLP-dependent enzyme
MADVFSRDVEQTLALSSAKRAELWGELASVIETYIDRVDEYPVAAAFDPAEIQHLLDSVDLQKRLEPTTALDFVVGALTKFQVHTPHPRYFGLFNPAPTAMGIVADALVAAFNPQLAAWSHSPFAVQVERYLVSSFGDRFGFNRTDADGTFTTGGAEANYTAIVAALVDRWPTVGDSGLRGVPRQPIIYVSAEGHHSVAKGARLAGIGSDAVRPIRVRSDLSLDVDALDAQIASDRRDGYEPLMIVATFGTTSSGTLDPIGAIADVAERERIWMHVDAAWGGAVALVPELAALLDGVARADSITFDPHKWLSVPMGAGLFLTRHPDLLGRAFSISTGYMPPAAGHPATADPYTHSMQWSRRFIGLKVFMSLLVAGWDGYAAVLRHQIAMGDRLRERLIAGRWHILNATPLPIVCFDDTTRVSRQEDHLKTILQQVLDSGRAWISLTSLDGRIPALRACITNYRTGEADVDALIDILNDARSAALRARLPKASRDAACS